MATVKLIVEIEDNTVTKAMMSAGFSRVIPIKEIDDPDWVNPGDGTVAPRIPEYPTVKASAEGFLGEQLMKIINRGLVLISQDDKQEFKKSMLIKQ